MYGHLLPITQTIQKKDEQNIMGNAGEWETNKQCFPIDSYTWTHQYWPTSKIHWPCVDTMCHQKELRRPIVDRAEWQEGFKGIIIIASGARGVMVIVVGYGHDDTSSNPGRDW